MLTQKDRREKKGEGYLTRRFGSCNELIYALKGNFYHLATSFVAVWCLVFVVANDKMEGRIARKTSYNSWLFGASAIGRWLLRCVVAILVGVGFVPPAASAADIVTVALSADNDLRRDSVLRPDLVGITKIDGSALTDADVDVQWLYCPTSDVADSACVPAADDATATASSWVFRQRPPAETPYLAARVTPTATGEAAYAAVTLARQPLIPPRQIFGDRLLYPESVYSVNPVLPPGYFVQNPVWSYSHARINLRIATSSLRIALSEFDEEHYEDSGQLAYESTIVNEFDSTVISVSLTALVVGFRMDARIRNERVTLLTPREYQDRPNHRLHLPDVAYQWQHGQRSDGGGVWNDITVGGDGRSWEISDAQLADGNFGPYVRVRMSSSLWPSVQHSRPVRVGGLSPVPSEPFPTYCRDNCGTYVIGDVLTFGQGDGGFFRRLQDAPLSPEEVNDYFDYTWEMSHLPDGPFVQIPSTDAIPSLTLSADLFNPELTGVTLRYIRLRAVGLYPDEIYFSETVDTQARGKFNGFVNIADSDSAPVPPVITESGQALYNYCPPSSCTRNTDYFHFGKTYYTDIHVRDVNQFTENSIREHWQMALNGGEFRDVFVGASYTPTLDDVRNLPGGDGDIGELRLRLRLVSTDRLSHQEMLDSAVLVHRGEPPEAIILAPDGVTVGAQLSLTVSIASDGYYEAVGVQWQTGADENYNDMDGATTRIFTLAVTDFNDGSSIIADSARAVITLRGGLSDSEKTMTSSIFPVNRPLRGDAYFSLVGDALTVGAELSLNVEDLHDPNGEGAIEVYWLADNPATQAVPVSSLFQLDETSLQALQDGKLKVAMWYFDAFGFGAFRTIHSDPVLQPFRVTAGIRDNRVTLLSPSAADSAGLIYQWQQGDIRVGDDGVRVTVWNNIIGNGNERSWEFSDAQLARAAAGNFGPYVRIRLADESGVVRDSSPVFIDGLTDVPSAPFIIDCNYCIVHFIGDVFSFRKGDGDFVRRLRDAPMPPEEIDDYFDYTWEMSHLPEGPFVAVSPVNAALLTLKADLFNPELTGVTLRYIRLRAAGLYPGEIFFSETVDTQERGLLRGEVNIVTDDSTALDPTLGSAFRQLVIPCFSSSCRQLTDRFRLGEAYRPGVLIWDGNQFTDDSLRYHWQMALNGGEFRDVSGDAAYTPTLDDARNLLGGAGVISELRLRLRLVITDRLSHRDVLDSAILVHGGALPEVILFEPEGLTAGALLSVTVNIASDSDYEVVGVQWRKRKGDGGSYDDIDGATERTLTLAAADFNRDGALVADQVWAAVRVRDRLSEIEKTVESDVLQVNEPLNHSEASFSVFGDALTVGAVLSVNVDHLHDPNGEGDIVVSWYAGAAALTPLAVSPAYRLDAAGLQALRDGTLRADVSYIDSLGFVTPLGANPDAALLSRLSLSPSAAIRGNRVTLLYPLAADSDGLTYQWQQANARFVKQGIHPTWNDITVGGDGRSWAPSDAQRAAGDFGPHVRIRLTDALGVVRYSSPVLVDGITRFPADAPFIISCSGCDADTGAPRLGSIFNFKQRAGVFSRRLQDARLSSEEVNDYFHYTWEMSHLPNSKFFSVGTIDMESLTLQARLFDPEHVAVTLRYIRFRAASLHPEEMFFSETVDTQAGGALSGSVDIVTGDFAVSPPALSDSDRRLSLPCPSPSCRRPADYFHFGEVYRASVTLSDVNRFTDDSLHYHWQMALNGGEFSDVFTGAAYTPTIDDARKLPGGDGDIRELRLRLRLAIKDSLSHQEILDSAVLVHGGEPPTAAVLAPDGVTVGARLSVTLILASDGDYDGEPVGVQWQTGAGESYNDIDGATARILTLVTADFNPADSVRAVVTARNRALNGEKTVTSSILRINEPLSGDTFLSVFGDALTIGVVLSLNVEDLHDANGDRSIQFRWLVDGGEIGPVSSSPAYQLDATGLRALQEDALRVDMWHLDAFGFASYRSIRPDTDLLSLRLSLRPSAALHDNRVTLSSPSAAASDGVRYQWQQGGVPVGGDGVTVWNDIAVGGDGRSWGFSDAQRARADAGDFGPYVRIRLSHTSGVVHHSSPVFIDGLTGVPSSPPFIIGCDNCGFFTPGDVFTFSKGDGDFIRLLRDAPLSREQIDDYFDYSWEMSHLPDGPFVAVSSADAVSLTLNADWFNPELTTVTLRYIRLRAAGLYPGEMFFSDAVDTQVSRPSAVRRSAQVTLLSPLEADSDGLTYQWQQGGIRVGDDGVGATVWNDIADGGDGRSWRFSDAQRARADAGDFGPYVRVGLRDALGDVLYSEPVFIDGLVGVPSPPFVIGCDGCDAYVLGDVLNFSKGDGNFFRRLRKKPLSREQIDDYFDYRWEMSHLPYGPFVAVSSTDGVSLTLNADWFNPERTNVTLRYVRLRADGFYPREIAYSDTVDTQDGGALSGTVDIVTGDFAAVTPTLSDSDRQLHIPCPSPSCRRPADYFHFEETYRAAVTVSDVNRLTDDSLRYHWQMALNGGAFSDVFVGAAYTPTLDDVRNLPGGAGDIDELRLRLRLAVRDQLSHQEILDSAVLVHGGKPPAATIVEPEGLTAGALLSVTVSVASNGNYEAVGVQWRKRLGDGGSYHEIDGATESILTLAAADFNRDGVLLADQVQAVVTVRYSLSNIAKTVTSAVLPVNKPLNHREVSFSVFGDALTVGATLSVNVGHLHDPNGDGDIVVIWRTDNGLGNLAASAAYQLDAAGLQALRDSALEVNVLYTDSLGFASSIDARPDADLLLRSSFRPATAIRDNRLTLLYPLPADSGGVRYQWQHGGVPVGGDGVTVWNDMSDGGAERSWGFSDAQRARAVAGDFGPYVRLGLTDALGIVRYSSPVLVDGLTGVPSSAPFVLGCNGCRSAPSKLVLFSHSTKPPARFSFGGCRTRDCHHPKLTTTLIIRGR